MYIFPRKNQEKLRNKMWHTNMNIFVTKYDDLNLLFSVTKRISLKKY